MIWPLPWARVWQWEEKSDKQPDKRQEEDKYPLDPVVCDVSDRLPDSELHVYRNV